jgi:hypothetical protein
LEKRDIEDVFAADNKGMDDPGIITKLANTIKFLELHKEKKISIRHEQESDLLLIDLNYYLYN